MDFSTQETHALLKNKYLFEARGKIDVKGKGLIPVFFLKIAIFIGQDVFFGLFF